MAPDARLWGRPRAGIAWNTQPCPRVQIGAVVLTRYQKVLCRLEPTSGCRRRSSVACEQLEPELEVRLGTGSFAA